VAVVAAAVGEVREKNESLDRSLGVVSVVLVIGRLNRVHQLHGYE